MHLRRYLYVVLLLIAGIEFGQAGFIECKAWLAQQLLLRAWIRSTNGEGKSRPWPWADTWPVARLSQSDLGIDLIVLAGGSGRVLAFGPGYLFGSAPPGTDGQTVISGHRDTHFRFLQILKKGMRLSLMLPNGDQWTYQVTDMQIIQKRQVERILRQIPTLTLVTCYPFGATLPGGDLRYVVSAVQVPFQASGTGELKVL